MIKTIIPYISFVRHNKCEKTRIPNCYFMRTIYFVCLNIGLLKKNARLQAVNHIYIYAVYIEVRVIVWFRHSVCIVLYLSVFLSNASIERKTRWSFYIVYAGFQSVFASLQVCKLWLERIESVCKPFVFVVVVAVCGII